MFRRNPDTPMVKGDAQTLAFYERYAEDVARQYEQIATDDLLALTFATPGRILDVGSGSGRDLAQLLARGHDAVGIEPSDGMRRQCLARHPQLAGRVLPGALPRALPSIAELGGTFDGVLCSAVIQHLPASHLTDAARALAGVLRARGRALVTVPVERPGLDAEQRDCGGRLYSPIASGPLIALFANVGLVATERLERPDGLHRPHHRWETIVLELKC